MGTDLKNIKELKINDEVYCKYLIEGDVIFLKRIKNIVKGEVGASEEFLIEIISYLENCSFSHSAFLNI